MKEIKAFRVVLSENGILPLLDIIADGKIHRCGTVKNPNSHDGAYLLHLDGIISGGYQDWANGAGWINWCSKKENDFTPAEREAWQQQQAAQQAARVEDRDQRYAEARVRAREYWEDVEDTDHPIRDTAITAHPYLKEKRTVPYGARLTSAIGLSGGCSENYAGLEGDLLMLPINDEDGNLQSLQFIAENGQKRYLSGGKKSGGRFLIGGVPDKTLCLCEGYATGVSLFEATKHPTAIAFDAGNLLAVAKSLRAKYPETTIMLCADDDHLTKGNPGLTKARAAAAEVGGVVAIPCFTEGRQEKDTDFNDMQNMHLDKQQGLDAVAAVINDCLSAGRLEPSQSQNNAVAAHGESDFIENTHQKISFSYGGGHFEVSKKGVYFVDAQDGAMSKSPIWVCSKIEVLGAARNNQSTEWGRLLSWHDLDQKRHQWAMPMTLLESDGGDLRRELARLGVRFASGTKARNLFLDFIKCYPTKSNRVRCTDKLGWHEGRYILPDGAVGQSTETIVFQNSNAIEPAFSTRGTLLEWRNHVAGKAVGNSRLLFAISCAFATPLLDLVGEGGGGFNLRGCSSSGKSTAQYAAASVYGHHKTYCRSWRATDNGLEGTACLHNDGLLILDELSQCDPKAAGEIAYMLANGGGKTRAQKNGEAKHTKKWRLLFLSSGEVSLSTLLAADGRKTNAGQEVRLADFDADAGAGWGCFENVQGCSTGSDFADSIKHAAESYYGTAGLAFLERLVTERPTLSAWCKAFIDRFLSDNIDGKNGQISRVCKRFALVAMGGELATHWGLTGWQVGDASVAAATCFTAWQHGFGEGNHEEGAILRQLKGFLEAHGSSRFESMTATFDQKVSNRVGFYRGVDGAREFIVLPESFKNEICKGLDAKAAARVLLKNGWLDGGTDNRASKPMRLPDLGLTKCYVFTPKVWQ